MMDVPVVLAMAGVIALLIGFLGGGIKAKELEIPSIPPIARVIVSLGGLILIGLSIWLFSPTAFASSPPTDLPAYTPTETSMTEPSTTPTKTSLPIVVEETSVPTVDLPALSDTFVEDFASGSKYWETGIDDTEQRISSRSVVNNVFRWQLTEKDNGGGTPEIDSKLPTLSDFDLEVTLKFVSGSDQVSYGVKFREINGAGYYFLIDTTGYYILDRWNPEDKEWKKLIDWTKSTNINLKGENKLRVYALGSKIRLYINDTLVADHVDNSLRSGTLGMAAWLEAGENLTLDMTAFKITLLSE